MCVFLLKQKKTDEFIKHTLNANFPISNTEIRYIPGYIEKSNKRETRKGTQFLFGFASFPSSSNASNAIQITQRKRTEVNAYLPIAGQIPNDDNKQKGEANARILRILLPNHSNGVRSFFSGSVPSQGSFHSKHTKFR